MSKAVSTKTEDVRARSYADRLILAELVQMESAVKLGELAERLSDAGLGLATVRSLLASNPERFQYFERKWIPASRIEGRGRPVCEAARLILERFGAPMPLELLAREIDRIRRRGYFDGEAQLYRLIEHDPSFIVTEAQEVALSEWAFLAHDETLERAFAVNGVDPADVATVQEKLGDFNWRSPDAASAALKAAAPVSLKALCAAAWLQLSPQDPRAVLLYDGRNMFAHLTSLPDFVYGSDGVLYPASEAKKWVSCAAKLADKLAPSIEVEDVNPIDVKPEDVKKMAAKVLGRDQSTTVTRLLEEFYEITPQNKTFPDDLANVMGALQSTPEVWWVGGDRFRRPNSAPDYIYSVPEPFRFPESTLLNEEGEPIDVELTDEGLSSSLRKLLQHPLATDVLDEEIMPALKNIPETIRLVLKSIHRELGTFPMCQIPTGYLSDKPAIQELMLVDPNGRELQVWANFDIRLIYGLVDWWYEQPVECGAVFKLTKTDQINVFEFAWDDQTDPLLFISSQRMEQLRQLQESSEGMSVLDLLIEIMHHWPKGADFLTLLAEVNVVRRTTRRMVASILSSYQCFYQRSGSPVWHFDAKKVELGFDKTKKKFIRK